MSQLFLSTTGSLATVVINDLGSITFVHPVINFELLQPAGNFEKDEIAGSADLQAALSAGHITITDPQGASISDLSNQAAIDSYVKATLADTTPGTLQDKISVTGNVSLTVLNAGGNETIRLDANVNASDINYVNTTSGLTATDVQAALDEIDGNVDTNSADITAINNSVGQPNGIASLDSSGLIPTAQLPPLSITDVTVVADITARDALTVQEGDVAIVTDAGDDPQVPSGQSATYIYDGSAWVRVVDGGEVYSVNGATGVVVLDAGDIAYTNTTSGLTATDTQAAIDELDGRIDTNETAITALQGDSHDAVTIAVDGVSDDALSVNASQVITANLATPTTDGVMSSADKSKLDGIAAGANNYIHPNHSGDVVSIGDGTTTIQSNVVDNAKLADVLSGTIKGRATAGIGDPEDLTATQVRALLNVEDNAAADQTAAEVPYTNTTSGLTATDVQAAIDELDATIDGLSGGHDAVTAADDSITVGGVGGQEISVNLDGTTGGGDNALVLTVGEGLYVAPSAGNTDLAIANRTATTLDVTSSTGNDATVPEATTTLAGLLTGSDKTKLDGIESGATADQNAGEVPYTNTTSGLTATDVQAAIDEVEARIDSLEGTDHAAVTLNGASTVTTQTLSLSTQEITVNAATPTTAGAMSATDKAKLDGVEANAKDDQNAVEVPYNNGDSGLSATNVKLALDELDADITAINDHDSVTLNAGSTTQDTLDLTGQELTVNLVTTSSDGAMSQADKTKLDGIETGATADQNASEVPYNNATSGIAATNVQSAIDIIEGRIDTLEGTSHDAVTLAANATTTDTLDLTGQEISVNLATPTTSGALSATDKTKLDTVETNAAADQIAAEVPYVNTTSGLTATDVQAAIDELDSSIDSLEMGGLNVFTTGINSNQNGSSYMRNEIGDFTNNTPYRLPYNIEIVAVSLFNRTSDPQGWDGELYVNGSLSDTYTVAIGTTYYGEILSSPISVTAGQTVETRFVNTQGRVQRPTMLVYYRIV